MLFLGTEKYPVENHYGKFISEHGGSKNAGTSFLTTYYYFDIANEHLHTASDIFSQFFKCPLFTEEAVEREINAVDSEFRKNYQLDSRKLYQVFKSHAANPLSHFSKFQTGNLEYLSKPGIRDALIKFHSEYYSSDIMNLCIYGKESIEDLEKLAIETFEDVENKNVKLEDRSEPHPFPLETLGKLFKIVPSKDIRKLSIKWILPDTKQLYKVKPGNYISQILGHEGPNSLLGYLIREGLVTELSSSFDHVLDACDYFTVSVTLTEEGEENYQKVMRIIFAAVNHLKEQDLKKYIFEEEQTMNKISFENEVKQKAISTTRHLAGRIKKLVDRNISMDQLLYYPYILEDFDEEAIKSHINEMKAHKTIVMFTTKKHHTKTDQIEVVYNTDFSCEDISQEFLDELDKITFEDIESKEEVMHKYKFDYPPKNEFIPYNTEIMKADTLQEFDKLDTSSFKNCNLWFKMDDKFDQPKVNVKAILRTNDLDHRINAKSKVFKNLWSSLARENLREFAYCASLAQIHYSLSTNVEGVTFSFHGFNDGIQNFIKEVMKLSSTRDQSFDQ